MDARNQTVEPEEGIHKFYLKHWMSCLPDQSFPVRIDAARRQVRVQVMVLDCALLARLVVEVLPEQAGIIAFRDDNYSNAAWLTEPSPYTLVVEIAGVAYNAHVVVLFQMSGAGRQVAVRLEPMTRVLAS